MRRKLLPLSQLRARLLPEAGHAPAARRAGAGRMLIAAALVAVTGLPFLSGTVSAAQAVESPDGLIHITLIPGASEARYTMQLRSLGQPPKQVACTTRDMTGELALTPDGAVVPELSQIVVNQRSLTCEAPLRDDMAQELLQTAQHPTATFTAQAMPGLQVPLTTGYQAYQMIGDQMVRGVTRSVTYDTEGTSTMEEFTGSSRAVLKMSDFGITPPSMGPLLQVDDEMIAETTIKATIAIPSPPGE